MQRNLLVALLFLALAAVTGCGGADKVHDTMPKAIADETTTGNKKPNGTQAPAEDASCEETCNAVPAGAEAVSSPDETERAACMARCNKEKEAP